MRLTDHFTLDELTHSQTAARLGLDNEPSPAVVDALTRTAHGLEMVRVLLQAPILVSSGYRSEGLREMDSAAPGELNLLVPVPLSFPPGPGKLTTMLEYRCNPLQDVVRPIGLEMNIPFEVLP